MTITHIGLKLDANVATGIIDDAVAKLRAIDESAVQPDLFADLANLAARLEHVVRPHVAGQLVPSKVTLDQPLTSQGPEELELGPFSQGVCFEVIDGSRVLVDVATHDKIARQDSDGDWIVDLTAENGIQPIAFYGRLFCQAIS